MSIYDVFRGLWGRVSGVGVEVVVQIEYHRVYWLVFLCFFVIVIESNSFSEVVRQLHD